MDGFWTGDYDRWRARFDLLLVLPASDGCVRVCVKELAGRWRWTERRARRLVEGLVEDGYLIHERRLSRGVLYRLCEALVDDPDVLVEDAAGPAPKVEAPPQAAVEAEPLESAADRPRSVEVPAAGERMELPAPARDELHQAEPAASPEPKARSSPLAPVLQLTPSERSVAAEVLKCKPQLVDQMLEVWVEFKEVRRRCLSALEHEISGCRLTERRGVKILDVLSSAGKDTVLEAVGNLPYSHWHCGTGRHARTGTKICPEAVFNVQQVQILSEIPDRVPVWEQVGSRSPLQQRIDFDGRGKLMEFKRRSHDVVSGGTARALGVR